MICFKIYVFCHTTILICSLCICSVLTTSTYTSYKSENLFRLPQRYQSPKTFKHSLQFQPRSQNVKYNHQQQHQEEIHHQHQFPQQQHQEEIHHQHQFPQQQHQCLPHTVTETHLRFKTLDRTISKAPQTKHYTKSAFHVVTQTVFVTQTHAEYRTQAVTAMSPITVYSTQTATRYVTQYYSQNSLYPGNVVFTDKIVSDGALHRPRSVITTKTMTQYLQQTTLACPTPVVHNSIQDFTTVSHVPQKYDTQSQHLNQFDDFKSSHLKSSVEHNDDNSLYTDDTPHYKSSYSIDPDYSTLIYKNDDASDVLHRDIPHLDYIEKHKTVYKNHEKKRHLFPEDDYKIPHSSYSYNYKDDFGPFKGYEGFSGFNFVGYNPFHNEYFPQAR